MSTCCSKQTKICQIETPSDKKIGQYISKSHATYVCMHTAGEFQPLGFVSTRMGCSMLLLLAATTTTPQHNQNSKNAITFLIFVRF